MKSNPSDDIIFNVSLDNFFKSLFANVENYLSGFEETQRKEEEVKILKAFGIGE